MGSFFDFVLRQRPLVFLGALVLVAAGVHAWTRLPVDAFPDVTNVQVMVLADAEGMTPLDVERQVTFPIETGMGGLPGVARIRSLSRAGLAQVVIVFEDDVDIYFARQIVFERLQGVVEELPAGVEAELGPISTGLGEVFQYTLRSDRHSLRELRTFQDWLVAPLLRMLPGVNEVNSFGGHVRQVHVLIDPARLLRYDLTVRDVLDAVAASNANAGGGFVVRDWEQAYVRTVGLATSIDDLSESVVAAPAGTPVLLKHVATITEGSQPRQGAVTRDGHGEVVGGMVIMLRGANSREVVESVKAALPRIREALPDGVELDVFYDRTELVQAAVGTVANALWQGGILVILVLVLFLRSFRAALVVALSLPLTALFAFLLMEWQDVTANLMSLGGLAVAIGMIVDASIVVTENIARHRARAPDESGAAVTGRALREVARPIAFAILIITIVFVPLFALEGMERKMFEPLALTMVFAMLGSLVVAFTVVPALASVLLRAAPGRRAGNDEPRQGPRPYRALLQWCFGHRWLTLGLAGGVFTGAIALLGGLGSEFLPPLDEGALAVNVVRLPSASLAGSIAASGYMEERILAYPEVESVVSKIGRPEISEDPMGPEQSDLIIALAPQSEWETGRSKADLVRALQKDLADVPGQRLSFSQPIALRVNELISGVKSDLAVKVFGDDLELLREHANAVAAVLGELPGASDVKVEVTAGFDQIEIVPRRAELARWGLTVEDLNAVVETAIGGTVATTLVDGQQRIAVLVRYPEADRRDPDAIRRILVPTAGGARVSLGSLATVSSVEAPAQISRESGRRRIVVEANVRERDLGGFVDEARTRLADVQAALPDGYWLEYGGTFENHERAMARLAIVVPLSVLLIFLLLLGAFGGLRDAALVLVNLPFALAGGVASMALFDINLSVSAAIGFIALFGIAVENGTVLVTFVRQLRERGRDRRTAVLEASGLRFRALAMTAFTTVGGLVPMALATGPGAEIQRPLAVVVIGGLLTSTALTLVVLPTLYEWLGGREAA